MFGLVKELWWIIPITFKSKQTEANAVNSAIDAIDWYLLHSSFICAGTFNCVYMNCMKLFVYGNVVSERITGSFKTPGSNQQTLINGVMRSFVVGVIVVVDQASFLPEQSCGESASGMQLGRRAMRTPVMRSRQGKSDAVIVLHRFALASSAPPCRPWNTWIFK